MKGWNYIQLNVSLVIYIFLHVLIELKDIASTTR